MPTFIDGLAAIYTGREAGSLYNPNVVAYGFNPTPKPVTAEDSSYDWHWDGYSWELVSK